MEPGQTARRSASHGALNCVFGSPSQAVCRLPRTLNENTNLFASPGPLESMLKTTTETGDIGVFSIKPTSTSASLHFPLPLRARTNIVDLKLGKSSNARGIAAPAIQDDRKRLPSYRDTTSEIISMYGSESLGSGSSLSPTFGDAGPRSYSMTSCSSRPLTNRQSNGTLQSRSSGSLLQRPRSPFPYPTRLKRPGVRPASPALTENGSVDYSKMVEIDRVSYRTIHGSYKPIYPQRRRPHPFPSRGHHAGVTSSLSSFGSLPPHVTQRDHASLQNHGWGDKFHRRLDRGSSDQSPRTSSLTSIVDMYQRPVLLGHSNRSPSLSSRSFYYDYTEDFDDPNDKTVICDSPLAPVPTRALSVNRPVVLEDDYSCRLEAHRSISALGSRPLSASTLSSIRRQSWVRELPRASERMTNNVTSVTSAVVESDQLRGAFPDADSSGVATEQGCLGPSVTGGSAVDESLERTSILTTVEHILAEPGPSERQVEGQNSGEIASRSQTVVFHGDDDQAHSQTFPSVRTSHDSGRGGDRSSLSLSDKRLSSSSRVEGCPPLPVLAEREGSMDSFLSSHPRRSKFYSVDPGLTDLVSLVRHMDKVAKSPSVNNYESVHDSSEAMDTSRPSLPSDVEASNPSNPSLKPNFRPALGQHGLLGQPLDYQKLAFRTCMEDHAAMEIDREYQGTHLENIPQVPPARSATPLIAPKPISPAKQLRLKNSIPRLMKALPPLPGYLMEGDSSCTLEPVDEFGLPVEFPPFRLSRLPTPRSAFSKAPSLRGGENAPENMDETPGDAKQEVNDSPETVLRHRLKLRRSRSCNPEARCSWNGKPRDTTETDSVPAGDALDPVAKTKMKLRLKISRSALNKASEEIIGTIRRNLGGEMRNALSEITSQPPSDLFSPLRQRGQRLRQVGTQFTSQAMQEDSKVNEGDDAFIGLSARRTSLGTTASYIPRVASIDTNLDATRRVSMSAYPVTPGEMPSFFSETTIERPVRGLRKHLSDLKARLAESRARRAEAPSVPSGVSEGPRLTAKVNVPTPLQPSVGTSGDLLAAKETLPEDEASFTHGKSLRQRLSKWVKSARQVIAACGRKRG